jgi:RNA polymerase sigma factor (sigma-70 family)
MDDLDDVELWRRSQDDEPAAFAALFDRYGNAVYGYCFRRTADWALAEDLTSVVFLEAWRRRRDIRIGANGVLPWLLGVATNVIRNQRRSLRRYRALLERIPPLDPERDFAEDLAERLDAELRVRALLSEIRRLPVAERDVLVLRWEGLSAVEIGVALGISDVTVRGRLFRARRRLGAIGSGADAGRCASSGGVNFP